jgi:hypothetical protein
VTHWLIVELDPQSPAFWILTNFAITLVLAALLFRFRSTSVQWLWVGQWILIPYCGLLLGGLSPRLMGLSYLNWVTTLGLGSGLLFVILILLVAVRAAIEFTETLPPQAHRSPRVNYAQANGAQTATTPAWQFIALVIFLGGAEEFHWAFLRGAIWEILLTAPNPLELPAYWTIWIAAAFIILENALWRPTFEQWLLQIALLATTSILFLYTRNFWLCWVLHSTAVLILTANRRSQTLLTRQITGAPR